MSRPTALPVILPAVLAIFTMSLGSEQERRNRIRPEHHQFPKLANPPPKMNHLLIGAPFSASRRRLAGGRSGCGGGRADRLLIMTEQAPRMTSSWPVENPSIFARTEAASARGWREGGEEGSGGGCGGSWPEGDPAAAAAAAVRGAACKTGRRRGDAWKWAGP